ncbi:hypothetical protein B0T14DRAFT_216559 [Immersiella caudata]|uniref:Uncharacterized protein n=1 Tax=Immersiella caudata TaxID=314043 RepID=A0AA39WQQ1_9PEZI|nr:hypothetical protein B0T14DRAFT_216559 [Immersiella caudata]
MPPQEQHRRPQPDRQFSNPPLTMAQPSVTMLAPSVHADVSMVELLAKFTGQSLSHLQSASSESTAGPPPRDASQLDCANSEHGAPSATKTVATAAPVVIEGGGRHPNMNRNSKGKEVAEPEAVLRDSACILTSPSFLRPKFARPPPPSLSRTTSQVSHDPRQAPAGLTASNNSAKATGNDDPADNSTLVAGPAATNTRGTVNQEDQSQNTGTRRSRYPRGLSHEELLHLLHVESVLRIQLALDCGAFNYPPLDLEQAHKDVNRNTAPKAIGDLIPPELMEARLEERSEYWKSFTPHIEEERRQLSSLKQQALERHSSKRAVEEAIIKVRMGIKGQIGRGVHIAESTPCLKVLYDSLKKADKEIAQFYAEWRERVTSLNDFIEKSLRPEYHSNEIEEELQAAQRAEDAQKVEFHRVNKLAGWGELTYPGDLAPDQRLSPSAAQLVTVPAWFEAFDLSKVVRLGGKASKQRYIDFLNTIHQLERRMREDATRKAEPTRKPKQFTKQWHDPHLGWPYPNWQKHGGWWVCRTGPGASAMEKQCKACRSKRDTEVTKQQGPSRPMPTAKETYDKIMTEVQKAIGLQSNKDEGKVKATLKREMEVRRAAVYRNGWDGGYLPDRS